MRRVLFGGWIVSLAALTGCGPGPTRPVWSDDMQAAADGSNAFAFDLYRKLADKPGNVFVSPFSAHAALAMTADGANGATRDEMAKVLRLPADRDKALAAGDLGRYYAAGGSGYELSVANAIWGQKGYPWRPEFLDRQRARFGAGLKEADFVGQPDAERRRVNAWAEEQTRGKIKDLLKPGMIDRLTRMVLANAIYFKGEWAERFDQRATKDAPFTLADGSKKPVPMMHRSGKFRLFTQLVAAKPGADRFERSVPDLQVAELPYKGGELSMVVVLPGRHDGLTDLAKKVSPEQIAEWLSKASDVRDVPIYLPKFRVESEYELSEPLKDLGMPTAFDPGRADFTGLHSGADQLFISYVVQKAFVDVNEEGTEAAAATAVVMTRTSAPAVRPEFRADRPFLFLIRDVKHGTILFMGRYEAP